MARALLPHQRNKVRGRYPVPILIIDSRVSRSKADVDQNMAKLVFGLQQSLDGYVDHLEMGPPGPAVFRHFVEHVRELAGIVYGRRTYEIMR